MSAFAAGGRTSLALLIAVTLGSAALHAQDACVHHQLKVTLSPAEHRLAVVDSITLPKDSPREMSFVLHGGMKPVCSTADVRLVKQEASRGPAPLESYKIILPPGVRTAAISYEGAIDQAARRGANLRAAAVLETPGVISADGVCLSESCAWYPAFKSAMVTFDLEVRMPGSWDAVSQGARTACDRTAKAATVSWKSPEPQESIFLIAARFTQYEKTAGPIEALVFLRTPEQALAEKYLAATVRYVAMYERLIGPYPYKKFALVENVSETGLGMPSFTLLGPTVIRLPFIISSSYPHEILHNWWGNGVYVDCAQGNWCEGLTSYLADHLFKEQQGGGVEYRIDALQKYADYVRAGKDFPLTQFRSRHDPATEAVGYGKSLMLFHMLRRELGDDVFRKGLEEFYRRYKFRQAAFDDIRATLESVSGKDLKQEFEQWVTRPGAPQLRVGQPAVTRQGDRFVLTALLEQTQPKEPFHLRVPLAVTLEGQERALQTTLEMSGKSRELKLLVPARPLRLDVDPEFDLFRRLGRDEMPPALSLALGAKKMLLVLPSTAADHLLQGYRLLAQSLGRSGPEQFEIKLDREVQELPSDRAIMVFGWENRHVAKVIESLAGYDVTVGEKNVTMDGVAIPRKDHGFALTTRMANHRDVALSLIAADLPESLPGLARKLPHYNKYSYLAFMGTEPTNVAKGRWPLVASPLTVLLPTGDKETARVKMGKLAPRKPLVNLTGGRPMNETHTP
jgi:aminopeptidase N